LINFAKNQIQNYMGDKFLNDCLIIYKDTSLYVENEKKLNLILFLYIEKKSYTNNFQL